jgi:UDP-3-O-[3-hydroxymyristoyl] glucosamine N-acyltransferase
VVQVQVDMNDGYNSWTGSGVFIEDDVILWSRVAINKDIVIGKGAVILATSAVDKSLEGGKQYFGTPAVEARVRWKEISAMRQLPDIIKKLS